MSLQSLAVAGTSRKENEHRVPIHPAHFDQIPPEICAAMTFERGYGLPFGVADDELERRFAGVASRAALLHDHDIVLLPKPLPADLSELQPGRTLWGWPHCVQGPEITQQAIDRRLTLIAWEAMFSWRGDVAELHSFYRNNEMAGYAAVIHAMGLAGFDGFYGPSLSALVMSHGSVSRGAIHALRGRGVDDITVCTQRPPVAVHDMIPGCRYTQMVRDDRGLSVIDENNVRRPMAAAIAEADIIVNGILQDTDNPLMFLEAGEEERLKPGSLIVDVSCDLAMGFTFARPTSFQAPSFAVGQSLYYAVDHTPSYLWRSSSWELSRVVVPLLRTVMSGPSGWDANETIRRAIEIRDGVIQNPKILSFQNRSPEYPHLDA